MARSALLNVMAQAAIKAGRSLARDFGELQNLQVSVKGPGNFVTNADKAAEKIIREQLLKARPNFGFLMEESGAIEGGDKQNRWIVDPLDGTTNFMHAMPIFAVSIALEREGKIVAGVVYNPILDELYSAERGQGAYLNDQRLRVAARRYLDEALVSTSLPNLGKTNHAEQLNRAANGMLSTVGVRSFGATALDMAFVAAGRLDGFWSNYIDYWDIAAGEILIREAGGFVSDYSGEQKQVEKRQIVCGNEHIHKALVDLVNKTSVGKR